MFTQTLETDKNQTEGGHGSNPPPSPPLGMVNANRTLGDHPRVHDIV